MSFARYFKTASYCLIGSGFVALAATGRIDWISIILFAAVFAGSWFLDTARIFKAVPGWALNCFALAYIPFFLIDYRFLSHSFMIGMFHLLFFTAAVKLLTLSKDRDYILLYLISFAELLAASTLTVNIVFAASFVIFLFSGITTLILFEMRRTNARMQNEGKVQPVVMPRQLQGTGMELFSPFPAGLLSAMVLGITALIIAIAVPIFFVLPRVNFGFYRQPSGKTQFTSGFSESVELGQIGRIKQSDAIVMRVKTDKSPPELPYGLKWRGIAFDQYDGRTWRRSSQIRRTVPVQGLYYKLENTAQGAGLINQTFFVEALSTNVIFAMHKPMAVSRDVGFLWRDSAESLYTARPATSKLRYFAVSDPIRPDPANISDLRPVPQEILRTYTQVPPGDPRVAELAREATKGAKDKYAKAQALERYLLTHYSYSLMLRGTPNSRDPLAMFLFDVRSGHCEYFASAMTIMLRNLQIPARLVNGFRAGEYNELGDNWIVRQYDAHSWVEAYFPPYGWIEFDPTPPDPRRPKAAWLRAVSNLADAVDLWWWEGVVNYDRSKQSRVFSGVRAGIADFQNSLKEFANSIQESFRAGMATLRSPQAVMKFLYGRFASWLPLIALAALLWIRPVRRRITSFIQRALHRGDPRISATSFYREALALLGAQGMKRGYAQTPMEFARSLRNHPAGESLLSLTRMYNAIRFGTPNAQFSRSEAEALLRTLRSALKTKAAHA